VVTPANPFLKTNFKDALHLCELNVRVGISALDLLKNFFAARRGATRLTQFH
jgi:hypothetical protein